MNADSQYPPITAPALLTAMQAAEYLSTGKNYVYRRINDGTLPTVQLATGSKPKTRIPRQALDKFITERMTGAAK